jgi:hypothetical protein
MCPERSVTYVSGRSLLPCNTDVLPRTALRERNPDRSTALRSSIVRPAHYAELHRGLRRFRDVLSRIATHSMRRIAELLPHNSKPLASALLVPARYSVRTTRFLSAAAEGFQFSGMGETGTYLLPQDTSATRTQHRGRTPSCRECATVSSADPVWTRALPAFL